MKKLLLILICAAMCFIITSCGAEQEGSEMNSITVEPQRTVSVSFINGVEEADIWILPQTEANVKTSLWGAATFPKLKKGERSEAKISDEAEGKFLVRIISADNAYYAARDVVLSEGYTVRFRTEGSVYGAALDIIDGSGNTLDTKENVFEGMLGAN